MFKKLRKVAAPLRFAATSAFCRGATNEDSRASQQYQRFCFVILSGAKDLLSDQGCYAHSDFCARNPVRVTLKSPIDCTGPPLQSRRSAACRVPPRFASALWTLTWVLRTTLLPTLSSSVTSVVDVFRIVEQRAARRIAIAWSLCTLGTVTFRPFRVVEEAKPPNGRATFARPFSAGSTPKQKSSPKIDDRAISTLATQSKPNNSRRESKRERSARRAPPQTWFPSASLHGRSRMRPPGCAPSSTPQ